MSVILRCPRCNRIWDYTGKSEVRATCPRCLATVYHKKNRVGAEALRDQLRTELQHALDQV